MGDGARGDGGRTVPAAFEPPLGHVDGVVAVHTPRTLV